MAFDKSEPKVAKLKANCEKLGIQCVKSFMYDGIKALDAEKHYNRENSEYILHLISLNHFPCLQAPALGLVCFVSYFFVLIKKRRKI